MIPYEELAAALEGHARAAASTQSTGAATLPPPPVHEGANAASYPHEPAALEDPTLNGLTQDAGPEVDLGDVLSDDEAS